MLAAPVKAQVANQAAIDQVEEILNSKAADADKQIAKIAKSYKKDAATITEIGRMYYYTKNYDMASEYAEKAKVASKFKYAGAYVLSGDIAAARDNGGGAAEDYQQAQYLDPKNPDGYVRYAYLMRKSGLNSALGVLETLHQNNPDFDVNYTSAQICKSIDNKAKAYDYFSKSKMEQIPEKELVEWATDLYVEDQFDLSLAAAQAGCKAYPSNAVFKRLTFFNNAGKKDYAKAISAAEDLFSDPSRLITMDYKIYAATLESAEKFDKAIEINKGLLNMENASDKEKDAARKNIAGLYSKMDKADEAVAAFKDYVSNGSNVTGADYRRLVSYQLQQAKNAPEEGKQAIYDEIFSNLQLVAEKYPDNKMAAELQMARISNMLAKAEDTRMYYEQYVETVLASDKVAEQKSSLIEAYNNLMFYYYQTAKSTTKAKEYAAKVLELDPEHSNAQKVAALK